MTLSKNGQKRLLPHCNDLDAAGAGAPELHEAQRVQQHLVPAAAPRLPGWEVATAFLPARLLSGDYCDVFTRGPCRLVVALGDVCGKGLGPALVAAGLRAVVRSRLPRRVGNLAGLMREVNSYLLSSTPEDCLVTLFLAVVDRETGCLRYVNAGHPAALLLRAVGDGEPVRLTSTGPVLGVHAGADFVEGRADLRPDCLLAVFSDGLPEARSPDDRMFRQERVLKALQGTPAGPASRALKRLLREVHVFCGARGPADDLSVILLRRWGEQRGQCFREC
jgi:sigma-B regulation protein RsbU (phosphoserine phosphatase)